VADILATVRPCSMKNAMYFRRKKKMVLIYFETPSLDFEKYDLTQLVE